MAGRVLLPSVSCRNARHLARSSLGQRQCNHSDFNGINDDDDLMGPLLARDSLSDLSASVHYQSIYDSGEFTGNLRNRLEVMRKRLRSHFMTPYEKYKHRGRKPWKLLLQLLKLVMITIQVYLLIVIVFNRKIQIFLAQLFCSFILRSHDTYSIACQSGVPTVFDQASLGLIICYSHWGSCHSSLNNEDLASVSVVIICWFLHLHQEWLLQFNSNCAKSIVMHLQFCYNE